MLGHERVQRLGLLQGAQLDKQRREAGAVAAHASGQFVEQEGLARAEVAEDKDEARMRLEEPFLHLREGILGMAFVLADVEAHSLRDVERGRIDRVALQSVGLLSGHRA